MDNNETKPTTAATAAKTSSDFRIFLIALLTSIIVVAVYHLATTCCKSCENEQPCITGPAQHYILVPVRNCGKFNRHGMFHKREMDQCHGKRMDRRGFKGPQGMMCPGKQGFPGPAFEKPCTKGMEPEMKNGKNKVEKTEMK